MNKKSSILGLIAVGAGFFLWGASNPIYKLGLEDIHPFIFGYLRFLFATLLIGGFLVYTGNLRSIPKKDWGAVLVATFFGIFLKIALLLYALPYVPSLSVSLIFASSPVFVFFASVLFYKEPYKRKHVIGMGVAFIGTMFTIMATAVNGGHGNVEMRIDALLLIILSMFLDIVHILISKRLLTHIEPTNYSLASFLVATLCFFPLAMWELWYGHQPALVINSHSVLAIAYAVIMSSIVAYYLFNWGLAHARITKASVLGFMDPFGAFLLAGPLLGERANMFHVIGVILIVGGVYWAEHHMQEKQPHQTHRIR